MSSKLQQADIFNHPALSSLPHNRTKMKSNGRFVQQRALDLARYKKGDWRYSDERDDEKYTNYRPDNVFGIAQHFPANCAISEQYYAPLDPNLIHHDYIDFRVKDPSGEIKASGGVWQADGEQHVIINNGFTVHGPRSHGKHTIKQRIEYRFSEEGDLLHVRLCLFNQPPPRQISEWKAEKTEANPDHDFIGNHQEIRATLILFLDRALQDISRGIMPDFSFLNKIAGIPIEDLEPLRQQALATGNDSLEDGPR